MAGSGLLSQTHKGACVSTHAYTHAHTCARIHTHISAAHLTLIPNTSKSTPIDQ